VVRERLRRNPSLSLRRRGPLDAIRDLVGRVDNLPADLSTRKKDYLRATGYGRRRSRRRRIRGGLAEPPRQASSLLRRSALVVSFALPDNLERVLKLIERYADVPTRVPSNPAVVQLSGG
jgi:hypothetical protein